MAIKTLTKKMIWSVILIKNEFLVFDIKGAKLNRGPSGNTHCSSVIPNLADTFL
jgi:hypothetical protein